jgi:radical SAM protein with 4Fe4S-binding SPASM domain
MKLANDTIGSAPLPFLISWNITKRCNLKCKHCYLDASELAGASELSTAEAKRVIDEIAALNPQSMLILTGGEPLMRDDCLELGEYAGSKGITVVLGTNGTVLNDGIVRAMVKSGIKGVGVSIDSATPAYHDRFRGLVGAWEGTNAGIDLLRKHGLDFTIQISVTKDNIDEIIPVIEYGIEKGARAVNIFFLVCTGRGQDVSDITPAQYESALTSLVKAARVYEDKIMVRARCAPHLLRIADKIDPDSPLMKGATSGCIASTGYMRITPEGEVTPCPYIPTVAGSIKETGLKEIWEGAGVFETMRARRYEGRCKECEYNDICGGCRARALAAKSDIMGEDPWCEYEPDGKAPSTSTAPQAPVAGIVWTKEAEERLVKVPGFLQSMVKKGVEMYARKKGLAKITPDIMSELRKRAGR